MFKKEEKQREKTTKNKQKKRHKKSLKSRKEFKETLHIVTGDINHHRNGNIQNSGSFTWQEKDNLTIDNRDSPCDSPEMKFGTHELQSNYGKIQINIKRKNH